MFKLVPSRYSRYRLTITAAFGLLLLFALTGATLYRLITASVEKERLHRQELFDRDLRELAGRFDGDERYVLEHNLEKLLPENRPIQPLLLPRQYYIGLPSGKPSVSPRPPPRNCYVDLVIPTSTATNKQHPDRFCAYFTGNRALGSYLFLAMTFVGQSVVPLSPGDTTLNADAIYLAINSGKNFAKWWLTFQPPRHDTSLDRFEVTAIRENEKGQRERDRRIEGWAYVQQQADGVKLVHLIARLDYHAIVPEQKPPVEHSASDEAVTTRKVRNKFGRRYPKIESDRNLEPWPPQGWQDIRIELGRRTPSSDAKRPPFSVPYSPDGVTSLSVSSLSTPFVNAYANLRIRQVLESGETKYLPPPPPSSLKGKVDGANSWIRLVDGDLLIRQESPILREQILPDTSLTFEVTHPGTVVEKGVWQTAGLLLSILIGFAALISHFYFRLLMPIWTLSARSTDLIKEPGATANELPYGNQNDEVGTLSTAFNELLRETRRRAAREHEERERRNEEARQRHIEEVRTRELNLKTIGHEIRSPLQALLGLHGPGDPSRRYVDKMIRAVKYLFGGAGPESSFDSVPITLQQIDVARFLSELASNAATAVTPIRDVDYIGPSSSVLCHLDPDAFEDTISHILDNAARFRTPSTPIRICLSQLGRDVSIAIANDGPHIPEDMLERIFELNFSLTEKRDETNQGLGLFVARNYVSRMSGRIAARNTPTGVEFVIVFPSIEPTV